ncbi:TetR/AcrR family transcriptional regulator [Streptomyces sp. NPDC049040]|uniref:TetR/AcrR family transcriptional regulator n=1 Tax=Streptomyces sp. NPDC049040 TaxID=3365593 RepID=UPI0037108A23
MSDFLPRKTRSDARDNRNRILDAARALLSTDGLDVPMREIARRAEVGPATLYRHFPTKQVLVAEAFADQLRACRTIVDEGCADPDPWRGLCLVIEQICELHARDRGFTEAFLSTLPEAPDVAGREYTVRAVAGLAKRAKDTGQLRPDFVLDDLVLVLMANKGIRAASPATQVMASRRFAGLVIQAFEARPHHAPLPPPARLASTPPPTARPRAGGRAASCEQGT